MTLAFGGLALGAVYALVAIGYNLVYISSKTFNFAQAQLMMFGAFVAFTGLVRWELPWPVVLLVAVVIVAAIAGVEERIAVRPVKDGHNVLVTTLGVAVFLEGVAHIMWGSQPLSVPFFLGNDAIDLFGGRVYPVELALMVAAPLVVLALVILSRKSLVGLALLGMSEDREAAQLRGVNVRKMAFLVFVATGAIAGAVGLLVGPKTFAVTTLGAALALKGFVALAIGGFGSMPGTLVGGLLVGLVEAYVARYLGGEFANLGIFLLLITVLMLRPAGLFVRSVERVV